MYGEIPPLPASVAVRAVPTVPVNDVVVMEGVAGTEIVTVPVLLVLATEVAVIVTVCAEPVAAGAVKVAEVVVLFDRVPAVVLQLTPWLFTSLATVAVRVMESAPSTVVDEALTLTLDGPELPPQAVRKIAKMVKA